MNVEGNVNGYVMDIMDLTFTIFSTFSIFVILDLLEHLVVDRLQIKDDQKKRLWLMHYAKSK